MIENIDFIYHEVIKTKEDKEGVLKEAKQRIKDNQKIVELVHKIHEAISNSAHKVYGIFNKDESYFKKEFNKYLEDIQGYDLFKESKNLIGNKDIQGSLVNLMNKENFSTGGSVLLIHYKNNNVPYFILSILKNKLGESLSISPDGIPEVKNTSQIDFNNLDYACRINVDIYKKDNQKNAICFIHKLGAKVSNYFIDFIGCEKFNNSKKNSELLYNVIKNLSNEKEEKETIITNTIEYCDNKKKNKEIIDIFDLSTFLFNDKDKINNYAMNNNISLDSSFSPSMSQIVKLRKVEYKGDWIEILKFSNDNLDKINYNENNSSVTFNDVPNFIRKVKEERGD